jgi:predicted CoA-binding protein
MPDSNIEDFYNSENFALIGMSRKRNNFAWSIYKTFTGAGRKIYPLHPEGGERNVVSFFKEFEDLPVKPDACIVCTDLKKHGDLIPRLSNSGIDKIWFQQGSYDKTILENARQNHFDPLTGCVLMYFPGISFGHRLHRFFHELFSKGKN